MKSIHLSCDIREIKEALEGMYAEVAYDGSPLLSEFVPNGMWFILKEGTDVAGAITLSKVNNVMWTPHVIIYEKFRGNNSEEWGKLVAAHMEQFEGAKKFLVLTPYKAAKKYAEKVGFTNVALLKKSIKKNGELLNQYMLEM